MELYYPIVRQGRIAFGFFFWFLSRVIEMFYREIKRTVVDGGKKGKRENNRKKRASMSDDHEMFLELARIYTSSSIPS